MADNLQTGNSPFNANNFESEKMFSLDRLEAFSDGVFSVAITLLVLNLRVPLTQDITALNPPNTLAHALIAEWPTYLSYVISFLTIGIIWANHHRTFTYITHADHLLRMFNLVLLMTVTLIPFTTELLATYMRVDTDTAKISDGQRTAAATYALVWILVAVAYNFVWIYARRKRLVDERLTADDLNNVSRRSFLGIPLYTVSFISALFNPLISIGICLLLAIFYLVA